MCNLTSDKTSIYDCLQLSTISLVLCLRANRFITPKDLVYVSGLCKRRHKKTHTHKPPRRPARAVNRTQCRVSRRSMKDLPLSSSEIKRRRRLMLPQQWHLSSHSARMCFFYISSRLPRRDITAYINVCLRIACISGRFESPICLCYG